MARKSAATLERWYRLEGTALANEVRDIADDLWRQQTMRRSRYLHNLQLFEKAALSNYSAAGYYSHDYLNRTIDADPLGLIRSAVQTGHAEIYAKQKPKPQFQTSGAEWKLRRKAQKLDKICEGILSQREGRWVDGWALMGDSAVECMVQGTAAIYVIADLAEKRIAHELVPVCELYVDPAEGRDPQNLFRVSPIDVDRAIALFVEGSGESAQAKRRAIENAEEFSGFERGALMGRTRSIRQVKMVTAWRLPLSKDDPGRVVVSIGGQVMAEGEWTAPAFPFAFLHWEPHRGGFWGAGVVEDGAKAAEDAGELDRRLLARAKIASGKRVYYADGAVPPEAFEQNGPETAIPVQAGQPMPQESLVPPFADAEFQYAQSKIRQFWDAIGISQVGAAARREPGVESAVAMRTLNDVKTGRQLPKGQRYEQVFVDLGHQYIWRLKELAEDDPNFAVRWPGKATLQEVKWKDADIGDNPFSIVVAPASALPNDPAGRLSMAGELFSQKLITPQTYKQLLGWPDLEQELQSESSEYEYIDALIDTYLDAEEGRWDAGEYESPDGAILDKPRALMRFSAAYFRAKRDKAPAFNIGLLRRYIQELDHLIQQATLAQAQLQQGMAPQPQPGAPPPQGQM
jgi:hypothetical protein